MSTRAPRPRTIPGEDPQPRDPSEVQRELLEDAAQTFSGKPPFLEYIDGLGQAEIECREVWIYRLRADGSKERQPGKTKAYLEICPLPVDSDGAPCLRQYVAGKYGGGRYEIFLKVRVPGQRNKLDDHHTATFDVDGPAKYPATPPDPAAAALAQPGAAATGDVVGLRILDKLDDLGKSRGDDPLTRAAGKVMDKALENFVDGPEKPAGLTGNPSLDALLVPLIARALTPAAVPAPVDPFENYTRMHTMITTIAREAMPPQPAPAPGRTSELVELGKAGLADLAVKIYGAQQEPASLGSAAGEALSTLIKERPSAIVEAWDMLRSAGSTLLSRLNAPPASASTSQPAANATAAATAPAGTPNDTGRVLPPVPSPAAGLGMPPQAAIDDVFAIVVRNFRIGLDGTAVGLIVLGAFPRMQPFLQMACSRELAEVLPDLRQQAAIAPILDHPRFPAFYDEFRQMCLAGLEPVEGLSGLEEPGEDGADGAVQASAASAQV